MKLSCHVKTTDYAPNKHPIIFHKITVKRSMLDQHQEKRKKQHSITKRFQLFVSNEDA